MGCFWSIWLTLLDANRRYSTLLDVTRRYSTLFDATRRYSTLLDATRRYSTLLDATRRYSTLLDATWRYSTLLDATRRYSTLLDATRRYSTLLDATRRYSTLLDATRRYSTLLDATWRYSTPLDATRRYSTFLLKQSKTRKLSVIGGARQKCRETHKGADFDQFDWEFMQSGGHVAKMSTHVVHIMLRDELSQKCSHFIKGYWFWIPQSICRFRKTKQTNQFGSLRLPTFFKT
jgi:hypothetical protein